MFPNKPQNKHKNLFFDMLKSKFNLVNLKANYVKNNKLR